MSVSDIHEMVVREWRDVDAWEWSAGASTADLAALPKYCLQVE